MYIGKGWNILNELGPKYGYYPQAKKSLIITTESERQVFLNIFKETGINIKVGARFLGGYIGENKNHYIGEKIQKWKNDIDKLTIACRDSPQAAYTALTKSVQFQWIFFQRIIDGVEEHFQTLDKALQNGFLPTLLGGNISIEESDLFSLPFDKGGLGILKPSRYSRLNYETSLKGNEQLISAVCQHNTLDLNQHYQRLLDIRKESKQKKDIEDEKIRNST